MANGIIPFANVNDTTRDKVTNSKVPNLSSFLTQIQAVSTIKWKPNFLKSKRANLEPDHIMDGPLTADAFFKYMKDYNKKLQNTISLVDIT